MMRKQLKKISIGIIAAGILMSGVTTATTVYAQEEAGAKIALSESDYTLEKMLLYAIEDEYLAQTEYQVIMNEFGEQRPFSNIILAENNHISFLTPLLQKYGVTIPQTDWYSKVTKPNSLTDAFEISKQAEIQNIAMYEKFLNEDLPDDVKDVFEDLKTASEKHLEAFQRSEVRNESGLGIGRQNRRAVDRSTVEREQPILNDNCTNLGIGRGSRRGL